MADLYEVIAAEKKLSRGLVWCTVCGNCERTNSANNLRNGWPKCCGYTMTIDSPEERQAFKQKQEAGGE